MSKILFNHPSGEQILVEIGLGGGVAPDCEVLFDERFHGEMPEIEIGKMEAYDELETVMEFGVPVYDPELDPMGASLKDEQGNVIFKSTPRQVLKRKLRKLDQAIPAHTQARNKEDQMRINAESLKYLASTDWYIIREMDCGIPCPADIKAARAEARSKIQ